MRKILQQGESNAARIVIKAGDTIQDPSLFFGMYVYLIHASSMQTLAKYGYDRDDVANNNMVDGYLPIRMHENEVGVDPQYYAEIRFSDAETGSVPAGQIDVQIALEIPDSTFGEGKKIVLIQKGRLAKLMRAKRN